MRIIVKFAIAAMLLAVLAACGGGGGQQPSVGGSQQPRGNVALSVTNYDKWQVRSVSQARSVAQGAVPELTLEQTKALARGIRNGADRFIMSAVLTNDATTGFRRNATTCNRRACSSGGNVVSLDIIDPAAIELDRRAVYTRLFTKNGVAVWQARSQLPGYRLPGSSTSVGVRALTLGGILKDSLFGVEAYGFYQGSRLDGVGAASYSYGRDPAVVNPISSATWRGSMVGIDYSPSTAGMIHGDANIDVEISATPTVDVRFSNVRNLDNTNTQYNTMNWSGLRLRDGRFVGTRIEGSFYGTDHQEVGGHFERGNVIGAFGAKRQETQ